MEAYYAFLNELINKNADQFNKNQNEINWINPYNAFEYEGQRSSLLKELDKKLNWDFKHTKPWINSLSRGCQICGEGSWSCLFVTGLCNAKCFYCPAKQNEDHIPATQQVTFSRADDYADYINHFGFKGVSISGGEPLISFERTLDFIKTIRNKCSRDTYIWMYTNGILAKKEKFQLLADAGLDEVRFDIGAVNYRIDNLLKAKDVIGNITVEIPAIPEDLGEMKAMLPKLVDAGVTNLNLHQLRLTEYNAPKLLNRNYTFLHGEQPTVIESELAAMKLIKEVLDRSIPLGVNYCCFQFKNRFQKAGYRRNVATKLLNNYETLTERGYIRSVFFNNSLLENNIDLKTLAEDMTIDDEIQIRYKSFILEDDKPSERNNGYNLEIGEKQYLISSFDAIEEIVLNRDDFVKFLKMIEGNNGEIPMSSKLFTAWRFEHIEKGWREFF